MAKRKGVHPLVSVAALAPIGLGLLAPSTTPPPRTTASVMSRRTHHGIAPLACALPFEAIEQHHPIDDSCAADGSSPPNSAQARQNDAKNNFCATGDPVNADFEVFHQLQKDAEDKGITFGGDSQIPEDRSPLRHLATKAGSIGEGTVARLAAFVIKAHYSNVGKGKGESVNCKQTDRESNDIHIVLGEKSNHDDECSSLTAEMSPHFRPETWDPSVLTDHNEHLYRFTGQLFFDASHKPCSGGKGSPKRSAIWEIHPVYNVEICTAAGNSCSVDSDEDWIPLSDFVGGASSDETRLWLPDDLNNGADFSTHTRERRLPSSRSLPEL